MKFGNGNKKYNRNAYTSISFFEKHSGYDTCQINKKDLNSYSVYNEYKN